MLTDDKELEQGYFETVKSFIASESERLSKFIDNCFDMVKSQGAKFNEDNPNGGMYSGMDLTQLHYEMQNEMQRAEEAKNDIWFYKKLINEPYFARVDFASDKTGRLQRVYIGLKTLQYPDTFDMLVCDWRAPVASLFYEDFPDGKAYFEAPAGKIEGELTLKRQYKFKNGELKYYIDSDLKINDDILREVLSEQSGNGGLKVIVNSIQREQNAAIRYNKSNNLLVTGAAGSGKTSVGFHRLAYLLYRNRKELSSAETVMFSNNDIFSSYVADIIPELGEMPINYSSFYAIFGAELPKYNAEDYYSLADRLISGDAVREKSVAFKFSEAFSDELKNAADSFLPAFASVSFYDAEVISAEELLNRFKSLEGTPPALRGNRLCDYASGKIDDYFAINKEEIFEIVDTETGVDEDTNRAIKLKRRLLKQDTARMITAALEFDPVVIYLKVLYPYLKKCGDDGSVASITEDTLKTGRLLFEDALAVVRLKQFMGSAAIIPTVKHILIDEAQDLCELQHTIILNMFPKASYTLLADTNQAILPAVNITSTDRLAELYKAEVLRLNKSYRSTAQINNFALSLLPECRRYEIFERSGEEVRISHGDAVENIKEMLGDFLKKSKNAAIITKTAAEAKRLYNTLKADIPNIKLCNSETDSLPEGTCVISLALTKGLEFDSVIVADTDGTFCDENSKGFLYMAATRALHRLGIAQNLVSNDV